MTTNIAHETRHEQQLKQPRLRRGDGGRESAQQRQGIWARVLWRASSHVALKCWLPHTLPQVRLTAERYYRHHEDKSRTAFSLTIVQNASEAYLPPPRRSCFGSSLTFHKHRRRCSALRRFYSKSVFSLGSSRIMRFATTLRLRSPRQAAATRLLFASTFHSTAFGT